MLEEFPKQEENARKWNIIKLLLTVCGMLLDTTAHQVNEYEHKQSVLPLRDSRAKRTYKRGRKSPAAWSPRHARSRHISKKGFYARLLLSAKERLLIVCN